MQTGVYDPLLIGDKAKWFCQALQKIEFPVYDEDSSSLGAAISAALEQRNSDEYPTGKWSTATSIPPVNSPFITVVLTLQ